MGERGGEPAHALSISELPTHTHVAEATSALAQFGSPGAAANRLVSKSNGSNLYAAPTNLQSMMNGTITNTAGTHAHLNMQPFLTLKLCIAPQGVFPSPN